MGIFDARDISEYAVGFADRSGDVYDRIYESHHARFCKAFYWSQGAADL